MAETDLEAITRDLLATPLEEFTAKRNVLVRELKRTGSASLATEVQALRRPPVTLWAANQLARQEGVLGAVREASLEAAEAQSRRDTDALRNALGRLQRALDAAASAAAGALEAGGHRATEDARIRVRELVRLAALHDDAWDQLTSGALIEEPEADGGLGMLLVGAPETTESKTPRATPRATRRKERNEADERRLREAKRAAADDARAVEQAEREAQRLRAHATELRERADDAERRASDAEQTASLARERAASSQAALEALPASNA